ncbi:hypothetical protein PM082_008737 [Marasmius tenuissimus]|nr:hypothetical protein PM082_008737 [Marasmius tenuissimus]
MPDPTGQIVSQSGVPVVPAPWKLGGRWWVLILSPLAKNASFPAGWCVDYQADALSQDEFVGGPGIIMVVQYDDSPAGPYDELIYVPGRFKHKDGSVSYRITRIYVSTKDSTENGRRNWNIPKQVAKFQYTRDPSSPHSWSLSVSTLPTESQPSPQPFFSVNIHPIPIVTQFIGLPLSTKILPGNLFGLTQPPLPKGPLAEEVEAGKETHEDAQSTKAKYAKMSPWVSGKMFFTRMSPGMENGTVGDGVMLPAVRPWALVGAMEGFDLIFPVSEWVEL